MEGYMRLERGTVRGAAGSRYRRWNHCLLFLGDSFRLLVGMETVASAGHAAYRVVETGRIPQSRS